MADWTQLDDLVQVSYSVTDAAIIYSRYTNHTWQLHVFRESEAYAVSFEGTTELEKVMAKRQPSPSNASSFIKWFVDSMVQGLLHVSFKGNKCKLSMRQELNLDLSITKETTIIWQLLVKMALHIQKQEGCRIKKQTPSSEKNDEKKSRVNELERENERLASMLTQSSAAASVPSSSSHQPDETEHPLLPSSGSRTVAVNPTLSAVRRKRKGMSLINPRAKRREKEEVEFEDIDDNDASNNDASNGTTSSGDEK